jgi:uncharacterized OB-fold protein
MTPGVTIWRCAGCRAALFPARLLCPRCHGARFETERVHEATVEEVSTIRHMVGQENWQPRRIANVRVFDDLRITVGLLDEAGPESTIALFQDSEAPFGRAK